MAVTVPRPGIPDRIPALEAVTDGARLPDVPPVEETAGEQEEQEYPLDLVGGAWNGVINGRVEALGSNPDDRSGLEFPLEKGDLLGSMYKVIEGRRPKRAAVSRLHDLDVVTRAASQLSNGAGTRKH